MKLDHDTEEGGTTGEYFSIRKSSIDAHPLGGRALSLNTALLRASLHNGQNPLHTFPRNFPVEREVKGRLCHGILPLTAISTFTFFTLYCVLYSR